MDLGVEKQDRMQQIRKFVQRVKIPLLLAAAGVAILLFPAQTKQAEPAPQTVSEAEQPDLDAQLTKMLSNVSGAGRVQVMLTLECGGKTEYEKDRQHTVRSDTTETRETTVVPSGNGNALIASVSSPVYRGAVVLCEGADSAQVRYNLVRAVSCLTGLTGDKIEVLKMKGSSEE